MRRCHLASFFVSLVIGNVQELVAGFIAVLTPKRGVWIESVVDCIRERENDRQGLFIAPNVRHRAKCVKPVSRSAFVKRRPVKETKLPLQETTSIATDYIQRQGFDCLFFKQCQTNWQLWSASLARHETLILAKYPYPNPYPSDVLTVTSIFEKGF